jgi:hypothetical protein
MPSPVVVSNGLANPVAILDKEIRNARAFQIEVFELCSLCGARFGIGYLGANEAHLPSAEMGELPRKLIEILSKDHWHSREHKCLIDLRY